MMSNPNGSNRYDPLHKVTSATARSLIGDKSSRGLSYADVYCWDLLQIKQFVSLALFSLLTTTPKPHLHSGGDGAISRGKLRAGLVGAREGRGENEQRPSSLSGIDRLYKSREMREIWPPLDWLESLTDRIITRGEGPGARESVCVMDWCRSALIWMIATACQHQIHSYHTLFICAFLL